MRQKDLSKEVCMAKEQQIKNVVLVGQGGVGKTMVAEAFIGEPKTAS